METAHWTFSWNSSRRHNPAFCAIDFEKVTSDFHSTLAHETAGVHVTLIHPFLGVEIIGFHVTLIPSSLFFEIVDMHCIIP